MGAHKPMQRIALVPVLTNGFGWEQNTLLPGQSSWGIALLHLYPSMINITHWLPCFLILSLHNNLTMNATAIYALTLPGTSNMAKQNIDQYMAYQNRPQQYLAYPNKHTTCTPQIFDLLRPTLTLAILLSTVLIWQKFSCYQSYHLLQIF